jgi:Na+-transporting methylmalonyl-CoA/oxaloacetate decarboxylase gamma subunit
MTQTGRPGDYDRVEVDRLAPRDEDEGYFTDQGQPAVERQSDDQDWFAAMGASRLIFVSLLGAFVIVGLLVAVSGGGLIFLVLAILALIIAGGLVTAFVMKITAQVEKPSPETVARLEGEGVRDPEAAVNDHIYALPEDEQDGADPESALDEPAREQQHKVTPSNESRPVGPDG